MTDIGILDTEYKNWLVDLKIKIRSVQLKAVVNINSLLIQFYWDLGKIIVEKQNQTVWGDNLITQLSKDLKAEFPQMKGLSRSNLFYAKQFYLFYELEFVQQPVGQIPWGHNILIFSKSIDMNEAKFYLQQTIENN